MADNSSVHESLMETAAALRVLIDLRADTDVVITHQGAAREWPKMSRHQLDFHFLPSAMGAAISFGVGLALAQPQRHIFVVTGEGSLLMNLGSLVTLIGSRVTNMTIVVLDNGAYAVTRLSADTGIEIESGLRHGRSDDRLSRYGSVLAA